MTTENIGLFQAMNAKMQYLQQRQKVISQNISNANTPNYRPNDLTKVDFGRTLGNVLERKGVAKVGLDATSPMHLSPDASMQARVQRQKATYEVKPDSNGVDVEEQMIKSSDVQMNYNLMLNVYASNMDMIRTSLGRRG
jgi:flagellar basal-body rod protein FlgB